MSVNDYPQDPLAQSLSSLNDATAPARHALADCAYSNWRRNPTSSETEGT